MLVDTSVRDPLGRKVIREDRPDIVRFASIADVPFKALNLTVVCAGCGGTPEMKNSPSDDTWKMDCVCAVRILKNPRSR